MNRKGTMESYYDWSSMEGARPFLDRAASVPFLSKNEELDCSRNIEVGKLSFHAISLATCAQARRTDVYDSARDYCNSRATALLGLARSKQEPEVHDRIRQGYEAKIYDLADTESHELLTTNIENGAEALERLVGSNVLLCAGMARTYVSPNRPFDELFQEGLILLMKIAGLYHYGRNRRFTSLAKPALRNGFIRLHEGYSIDRIRRERIIEVELPEDIDKDAASNLYECGIEEELGNRHLRQQLLAHLRSRLTDVEYEFIVRRYGFGSSAPEELGTIAREMRLTQAHVLNVLHPKVKKALGSDEHIKELCQSVLRT